jgi:two-component system sensor histidine kinase FlrB
VRTPLATALLYASQLGRTALADADRQRMAEKILGRLRNLERQVSDMLLFARGGAAILEPLALAGLIDGLVQALAPQLDASGCRLRIDNRAPDIVLAANREALTGALLNLLENAISVCGGDGQIALDVEVVDAHIYIRVRDNGPGIAPEIAARVFEPFFTTRASGTGLGLTVVQAVAEAHGGMAWVDSELGRGATFGLRLPVKQFQVSSFKSQVENAETGPQPSTRNLKLEAGSSSEGGSE